MTNSQQTLDVAESLLLEILAKAPEDWNNRKKLAHLLYNEGKTVRAAEIVWNAPEIPSVDLELGFAIKILAKGIPRRAIRLITSIQEGNKNKPAQNLGLANALVHYGMVILAARFYGAAVAEDPSLANADLEHFLLWTDSEEKIWGDFNENKPALGELPWMKRNSAEAENLKKAMQGHTTPIRVPNLKSVSSEEIVHEMYVQSPNLGAAPTPPPSVSIPTASVLPKDRVYDNERGADQPLTAEQAKRLKAKKDAANPQSNALGAGLPPQAAPVSENIKPPLPPRSIGTNSGLDAKSLLAAARPLLRKQQ
ncbi:MAG: hypothetical protein ACSHX0_05650 [Akkermansiaceae bacterium]